MDRRDIGYIARTRDVGGFITQIAISNELHLHLLDETTTSFSKSCIHLALNVNPKIQDLYISEG